MSIESANYNSAYNFTNIFTFTALLQIHLQDSTGLFTVVFSLYKKKNGNSSSAYWTMQSNILSISDEKYLDFTFSFSGPYLRGGHIGHGQ